jgi:ribonucleotide reductase alpha subunit
VRDGRRRLVRVTESTEFAVSAVPAADLRDYIWRSRYRLADGCHEDASRDGTSHRVANALAAAERAGERAAWATRFHELLASEAFLPGGRIIAGAGSGRRVTLFNCFVMGPVEDSMRGILRSLRESVLTMQQGGGVGIDFSTLRPRGTPARHTGGIASGPVSFMALWDSACQTLLSTGPRRGAMMATLRCDHPDIEEFVDAKRETEVLANFNLSVLVSDAFTASAHLDRDALADATAIATRMLDDVIDVSRFPLPQLAAQARGSRRIGIGITGLADALLMLGIRYGSDAACKEAAETMRGICHAAYRASVELARERGSFPFLDRARYLQAPFFAALPRAVRDAIAVSGIRNSHLTAIAPAGSISLLAGGVSSGIEPVFAARYRRVVREAGNGTRTLEVEDPAVTAWRDRGGAGLPPGFVDTTGVSSAEQLAMQAALQQYVDSAISKTVTVPSDTAFEEFSSIYQQAHRLGLKGCTAYRPGIPRGSVLQPAAGHAAGPHCCDKHLAQRP